MRANGKRLKVSLVAAALVVGAAWLPTSCANGDTVGETVREDWEPDGLGAYLSARYAEVNGDIASAAAYYPIALSKDPDNTSLLRRSYFFTAVDGDIHASSEYAKRLMAQEPNAILPPLVVVTDLIAAGDLNGAEQVLTTQNRQGLNAFLVPIMLAWVKYGQNDIEAAIATLEQMNNNGNFRALGTLHRALMEESNGDIASASRSFDRYLALADMPSLRGVQLAGGFLARNGDEKRAEMLAQGYAIRFPDSLLLENALLDFESESDGIPVADTRDGVAELFYGTASFLTRDDFQTAALFNRLALHLRPDYPLCQLLMGQLLLEQGRYAEARSFFRAVGDAHATLGLPAGLAEADSFRAEGNMKEAVSALQRVAKVHPTRPDPLIELGDIFRVEEDFDQCAKAYSLAIDRLGDLAERHWSILFGRGVCYERTKRWDLAEDDFKTALKLKPDQPYVLNYLGYSWVDRGIHLTEAKALIERAVALRPKDGAIIDSLGWVHFRLGDYAQAVNVLEWAVREVPDDPTVNDHLGDAYWMTDRKREAEFQWERALNLSEDDTQKADIQNKLDGRYDPPEPVAPKAAATAQ